MSEFRLRSPSVSAHCPELGLPGAAAGERLSADQTRAGGRQRLLPVQSQQRRGRRHQQEHVPHRQK